MPDLDEDVRALASRLSGSVDSTGTFERVRGKVQNRSRVRPLRMASLYVSVAVIVFLGFIPIYLAFRGTHTVHDGVRQSSGPSTPPPSVQANFAVLGGNGSSVLYILSTTGTQRVISRDRGLTGPPSWSPDGSRLVVIRFLHESSHQLVIVDVATGRETVLTSLKAPNAPAWSPLGDEIAFPTEYGDIYVIHPDGTGLRKVTNSGGPCGDGAIVWSANGSQIAFSRDCNGASGQGTYVVSLDGSGLHQIASEVAYVAWPPSGRILVFPRFTAPGGWGLYRMEPDGTGWRLLTAFDGTPPTWSPDGRYMAVVRSGVVEIFDPNGRSVASLSSSHGLEAVYTTWSP